MGLNQSALNGRGCQHTNNDGLQCRAYAVKNSDRCISHSDKATRDAAASKMKITHQKRSNPDSVSDLLEGSSWDLRTVAKLMKLIMRDVHAERITLATAHALNALASSSIRALDKGILEDRLEYL